MSFTGSCTEDEPNFPRQNNLILQKKVSGLDKVVNFKDFSSPNEEIKYFSRTLTEFKDFSGWLVNFKTFSRLYKPCSPDIWAYRYLAATPLCLCLIYDYCYQINTNEYAFLFINLSERQ